MLDALVTEARLRWGLDPAAGLQVVAERDADRHADRAVAAGAGRARSRSCAAGRTVRGPADVDPAARSRRARRTGPAGRAAAGSIPADHPVGRFGTRRRHDGRRADDRRPRRARSTSRPLAPELAVAGPVGDALDSAPGCAQPDGCPWDREQTHESLRKHLLEEAYEVYDALEAGRHAGARRGARRPAAPGRPPRPARRRGGRLRPDRRPGGARRARSSVAIRMSSARPRRGPRPTSTASGSGSRPTSGPTRPPGRRGRAHAGRRRRARSTGSAPSMPALAASQEMQERAAHLGYDWPSLDGVLDKVVEETDELREAAAAAIRAPGPRSSATCCSCSSTSPASAASRPRRPSARPTRSSVAASPVSSARRLPGGRPARPRLRRTRRAVGRRQGRGEDDAMTIGNRPADASAHDGRGPRDLRPISFQLGVQKWAEGSCLVRFGDTQVLCAATIVDRVPPHLRGKGTGWVTAEYAMLPRATAERTRPRVGQGPDRRPDPRDPAPHRPLAARRRRPRQARRADRDRRLRRAPGRRRDADGVDHRRLRRAGRGAHHVRHGAPADAAGRGDLGRHRRTGWRTSTSTTPRTRAPRST